MYVQLAEADEALQESQRRCLQVQAKVQQMEVELQQQLHEKETVEKETLLCQTRLSRASFLTQGLTTEAVINPKHS